VSTAFFSLNTPKNDFICDNRSLHHIHSCSPQNKKIPKRTKVRNQPQKKSIRKRKKKKKLRIKKSASSKSIEKKISLLMYEGSVIVFLPSTGDWFLIGDLFFVLFLESRT
jgi:hypothetical protein